MTETAEMEPLDAPLSPDVDEGLTTTTEIDLENNEPKMSRKQSWMGESASNLKTWNRINPVSLTWENLTVTVSGKEKGSTKDILKAVNGCAPYGKIVVILGPSGAGKTTLLKALSGQQTISKGRICYEGQEQNTNRSLLDDDIMGFQGNSSFLAQEPVMMGSLTVRETIYISARLKLVDPNIDINERVDNILRYLGLDSCADTKLGTVFYKGVSGGEKRRVSIGVELVSQPAIIFMDEPTSNLDATSAYALMNVANKLTQLNHTIIMTLHQPSSRIYNLLCDWRSYLVILEAGRTIYNGDINNAGQFFSDCGYPVPNLTNPMDHFLDVINSNFQESTENADNCHKNFKENVLPKLQNEIETINKNAKPQNKTRLHHVNHFESIIILLYRNFLNDLRNPAKFLIRLVMYTGLCVALGSLYIKIGDKQKDVQDRISILFFVAAFLTFMSISGMPAFVEERSVFIRERMNNHYGPLAYSIASFISSLPWIFLIALSSTFFIHFMIQSRLGGYHFGIYLANLFMALVVAESLMLTISAVSPVFMIGLAAGAAMLGLYMILCGFFLLPENIPPGWKWAHHAISFHTYSFQIFMVNEFRGRDTNNSNGVGGFNGNDILKQYSMGNVSISFNFGILIVMTFCYRGLFYLFLKLFNKKLA